MAGIFGSKGDSIATMGNFDIAQSGGKSVTQTHMGNFSQRSDGGMTMKVGNILYQDGNGRNRTVNRVGDTWYASDGKQYTYMQCMLLCSDGRSWSGVYSHEDAERIIRLD